MFIIHAPLFCRPAEEHVGVDVFEGLVLVEGGAAESWRAERQKFM